MDTSLHLLPATLPIPQPTTPCPALPCPAATPYPTAPLHPTPQYFLNPLQTCEWVSLLYTTPTPAAVNTTSPPLV